MITLNLKLSRHGRSASLPVSGDRTISVLTMHFARSCIGCCKQLYHVSDSHGPGGRRGEFQVGPANGHVQVALERQWLASFFFSVSLCLVSGASHSFLGRRLAGAALIGPRLASTMKRQHHDAMMMGGDSVNLRRRLDGS